MSSLHVDALGPGIILVCEGYGIIDPKVFKCPKV